MDGVEAEPFSHDGLVDERAMPGRLGLAHTSGGIGQQIPQAGERYFHG